MPLTPEQIAAFTQKAKQAGATDQQIMVSIAKKQAQIAQQEKVNQAAEAGILDPEAAFEAGADVNIIKGQKKKSAGEAKKPIIDAVSQLLERETGPITGMLQLRSNIPGTEAATTKNMFDQIQGLLSLENRSQLKGSGAISDFEAQLLQKAASSLGRNQSDTEFRKTLQSLLQGFNEQQGGLDSDDDLLINRYKGK